MNTTLWKSNHPRNFWQCQPDLSDEVWQNAIAEAFPVLGLQTDYLDVHDLLMNTLGEHRFGPKHWRLSFPKRAYYFLKPLLPRALTRIMRRLYQNPQKATANNPWPIDDRYTQFLSKILAQILQATPGRELSIRAFWPHHKPYSFVLTHDVETKIGVDYVRNVADLEESFGFRSSFNFVPERYHVDPKLLDELRSRGFEIGVHGLKHDGKLFSSKKVFDRRAIKINRYLKEYGAVGFRAPLTHRNPEWMQALEIEYDLSFFDTDPFEPMPGGTMSIWPFFLGHFVELPYTLVQDYSLTAVLGETSPHIWLKKVDYIEKHQGMALLNSHPDYLKEPNNLEIYSAFLAAMKERNNYWHALPRDVARWWRDRAAPGSFDRPQQSSISTVTVVDGEIRIEPDKN
jgi:hypothetical protein